MAGHSKWSKVKRIKEVKDVKKASFFTKLSKDISTAVKVGQGSDPVFNPMLRVAIDAAKAGNMPNDKIEKAIQKGSGLNKGEGQIFTNTYEVMFGQNIDILVNAETDNPNRTLFEIRTICTKNGAKMVNPGSISWKFGEYGLIKIELNEDVAKEDIESFVLRVLDINGVEDVNENGYEIDIYTVKERLYDVYKAVEIVLIGKITKIELVSRARNLIKVSQDELSKLDAFVSELEEVSEVSNIFSNVDYESSGD